MIDRGKYNINLFISSKCICEYLLYAMHIKYRQELFTLLFSRWGNISKIIHVKIKNCNKYYFIKDTRVKIELKITRWTAKKQSMALVSFSAIANLKWRKGKK